MVHPERGEQRECTDERDADPERRPGSELQVEEESECDQDERQSENSVLDQELEAPARVRWTDPAIRMQSPRWGAASENPSTYACTASATSRTLSSPTR